MKGSAKISKEREKPIVSAAKPPLSCFYLILVSAVFASYLWNAASPNLREDLAIQSADTVADKHFFPVLHLQIGRKDHPDKFSDLIGSAGTAETWLI